MNSAAATRIEHLGERFNAASDLLDASRGSWNGDAIALIDRKGQLSYANLRENVLRMAELLGAMGIQREQRLLLCLPDDRDFVIAFLGAIHAGIVPVPLNTLLFTEDYRYLLDDSRAAGAIVADELMDAWAPLALERPALPILTFAADDTLERKLAGLEAQSPADTHRDEVAFWLYSSGSTGRPKAALHTHASLRLTANLFGQGVLGIRRGDTILSVAKLFFAYGLGNALTFPLAAGATAVLNDGRPTAETIADLAQRHRITILAGVPTFFANWLAQPAVPALPDLRLAVSAGETLPAHVGEAFRAHHGVDIVDGLGSTEMLHVFVSQRPGGVRYGLTGRAVPGYDIRIVDDYGRDAGVGEEGELVVRGPTSAVGYWLNRPRALETFDGEWTHTRDRCVIDADGWLVHLGRIDDMLKVSGLYVSPGEVEAALCSHRAVIEAAVVGEETKDGLVKPIAFVVLGSGFEGNDTMAEDIVRHARSRLAPHKYPRRITFLDALPKTATGKIQRYLLREGVA